MKRLLTPFPGRLAVGKRIAGRLLFLLLLAAVSGSAMAQPRKNVTLSLQNAGYEEIFRQLRAQTGYTFVYNNDQIDRTAKVNVQASDQSVFEVLDRLFRDTNLSYSLVDNQIVITHKAPSRQAAVQDVKLHVNDRATREPIVGAVCLLTDLGIYALTDAEGKAVLKNVPAGENRLEIRMMGYRTINVVMNAGVTTEFYYKLDEVSLKMREVSVVATRNPNDMTTGATIERQAIDHIQAVSLSDLMELLPGGVVSGAKSMNSPEKLTLRTLDNGDKNNSFGAAVIIDGMQLSNNATLDGHTSGISTTAGSGIDLRAIGTDDIESVEVMLGVPSVEYGDLNSGAVIVKTKVGEAPLRIRGKINPGIKQASVSKGWRFGEKNSTFNANFDYARAAGDPRQKAVSLDRINASLGYGYNVSDRWSTTTRLRMSTLLDWQGQDPDALASGAETDSKNYNFTFSHEGNISVNKRFSRSLNYNVGVQYGYIDQYQTRIVQRTGTIEPLFNATETGIHEALLLPNSYRASGGTQSKPFSVSAKVTDNFYFRTHGLNQRFKVGAEFRYEKNYGRGNYNDDQDLPLNWSAARERSFRDVPALTQVAAYLEDNIDFKLGGRLFKIQAGLRYTAIQPGQDEFVHSLSPRVNLRYEAFKWLTIRGAYGRTSKTPGMIHLYPEKKYIDHKIVDYTPNAENERLVMYQTQVIDVPFSDWLKNSTSTHWEAGLDIRLSKTVRLGIDAYRTYNPNGFETISRYTGYRVTTYAVGKGITPVPGQKPTLDFMEPGYAGEYNRTGIVYASQGLYGNTAHARNQGIEFTFDLGRINPINTNVYFSGAYMESESWSNKRNYSNPVSKEADVPALTLGTTDSPRFRLEYPNSRLRDVSRRLSSTLRLVYNIPKLQMVASGVFQTIWFTYSEDINPKTRPIGYFLFEEVDGRFVEKYTAITDQMLADDQYRIEGILLKDQVHNGKEDEGTWYKPLFLFNFRLTKNIGEMAGFSFYANNATYHQPWQRNSKASSKTEFNSDIEFGFELTFKF